MGVVTTGHGEIIHVDTAEQAIDVLRQHRNDKYCTVWGFGYDGDLAIARAADYVGATAAECEAKLDYIAGRTRQILGHDGSMATDYAIKVLAKTLSS